MGDPSDDLKIGRTKDRPTPNPSTPNPSTPNPSTPNPKTPDTSTPNPKTVVVVDDHQLLREGTRQIVERAGGFSVVGEAGDAEGALAQVAACRPDVVLLDVRLPTRSGLEVAAQLREISPATRVVMLSAFDDPGYVRAALAAGVSGYLLKTTPATELVRSIRTALTGVVVLDPKLSGYLGTTNQGASRRLPNASETLSSRVAGDRKLSSDPSRAETPPTPALQEPTPATPALQEPTPATPALQEPTPATPTLQEPTPATPTLQEPTPPTPAPGARSPAGEVGRSAEFAIGTLLSGDVLTSREVEVVKLVARGLSNKEIAVALGISRRTVEAHLNHVFEKVGTTSRTRLIAIAVGERMVGG
ncbi:MAG: response regulator [Actinobacteria bacterium]|nr:response regulator [Actinomycetota bacterium]